MATEEDRYIKLRWALQVRRTSSMKRHHISEMVPDDDSAPEVYTGPMGRDHDPRNGSDIETGARRQFSRQLDQGICWSAIGRGKLLNPSKERTGDPLIV